MYYKISYGVTTGSYHLSLAKDGDDRVMVRFPEGGICAAALADGAGSRIKSGMGAEIVSAAACTYLCRNFDELWQLSDEKARSNILAFCKDKLKKTEEPLFNLASTLLFFAADQDGRTITGHLGDGIQILVDDCYEMKVVSLPENGQSKNETYFVTSKDALEHLRIAKVRRTGNGTFLMMSDGMADVLFDSVEGHPANACKKIAQWLRNNPQEFVSEMIRENMSESFLSRTSDDMSIVAINWSEERTELL